jgi:hypothetical protein
VSSLFRGSGQKCLSSSPSPSPGLGSGSAHFDDGELVSFDSDLLKEILKSQRPSIFSYITIHSTLRESGIRASPMGVCVA